MFQGQMICQLKTMVHCKNVIFSLLITFSRLIIHQNEALCMFYTPV